MIKKWKRRVLNLIEHPSKTHTLTELKFQRSRNWIVAPDLLSLSQTMFKTQSICTPRSSNIHSLHSWNIHRSGHGIQNLNFIHRMYRLGLPSISADLPPIGQLTGLGPFNQWLLAYTCSARPQTCFFNRMQQQDADNTLFDPKLMYCKH
jgi:hypothetical protein